MKISEKWSKLRHSVGYVFMLIFLVRAAEDATVVKEGGIKLKDIAPSDYDYLHAPKNSSEPLSVAISINKINLRSLDESDMSFSVTLEMWQSWTDYRLSYPGWAMENSSILDSSWINKIWNPKLYFMNAVDGKMDNIITPSSFFWLNRDRTIYYCCRVILKLICEMDLKYFPHDKQQCGIQMSSSIYADNNMVLEWRRRRDPQLVRLQQFDVAGLEWKNFEIPFGPNNLSCLELAVILQRRTGYFVINVYIPTILIVIMSMLTFWIPPDAVPARITLGVTSLLTIITKQYQAAMPSVSYIVALNVWLSCCIAFVFFSLLEFAAVIAFSTNAKKSDKGPLPNPDFMFPMVMLRSNGTWSTKGNSWTKKKLPAGKKESKLPKRLDYFSRVFFPVSFIVFAIIYWFIYDNGAK